MTTKKLFFERKWNINTMKSKTGEILIETKQEAKRWNEYLGLYAGHLNENVLENEDTVKEDEKRYYLHPSIRNWFCNRKSKNNKICGIRKLIKYAGEGVNKKLVNIWNEMYLLYYWKNDRGLQKRHIVTFPLPKKENNELWGTIEL